MRSIQHVRIGDQTSFSKTVGESDVYLFAGITGDFCGNHVNEEFMRDSIYGRRIAHGALAVGFMSTTSSQFIEKVMALETSGDATPVSLGYDRVRFLKPIFIGDTITVTYEIDGVDIECLRTTAKVEAHNQQGELAAVATHILKWTPRAAKA